MSPRRSRALLLLASVLVGCPAAQPRIAAVRPFSPAAAPDEQTALLTARFPDGAVAYLLADPATGEVLADHDGALPLPPGSVAKVPTCAAALELLGPAHRFATAVLRSGDVREGTLAGDLVLRGGGDPFLSTPDLAALAHAVRAAGIRRVGGALLYDDSLYAPAERIDAEQNDDANYNPGVGALALDLNILAVRWRPAPEGAVEAWAVPPGAVEVGLQPAPGPTRFARGLGAQGEPWAMSPALPFKGEQSLPVWRPGEHAAQVFAALLREMGVEVAAPRAGAAPPGAVIIAAHESLPLADIAREVLEVSQNVVAEMLNLAVARKRLGRAPSLADAAAELNAFWREKGVEMSLQNGSGLSGRSRMSPKAAVSVLLEGRKLRGPPFFSLLPAAGFSGTLAHRLATPDVALRAWAKTGTITYGRALAGHLFARSGRELLFAIFVAEPALRDAAIATRPATREAAARADAVEDLWVARARGLQESLVTLWIARY